MERKEDTPSRIIKRRYEEKNKEKRRAANGTFSTYLPRGELDEINSFLKEHGISKVELIRQGYRSIQEKLKSGSATQFKA